MQSFDRRQATSVGWAITWTFPRRRSNGCSKDL
jgi:hypothetical protein